MAAGSEPRDFRHAIRERRFAAFSLVELLVVLAIAAILLTAAVPAFRELIRNQQVTTATNEFFVAINLARSEAIKRGARVNLATMDGLGNWGSGWIVFVDHNDNGALDAGDETIFERASPGGGIAITLNNSAPWLFFNGTGRIFTNNGSQFAGTFSFAADGKEMKRIRVHFLGRPRVCNPATDKSC